MKTRTVRLYCDLMPGWHEAVNSGLCLSAWTRPVEPLEGSKRVLITVDLPIVERVERFDWEVKGKTTLSHE